MATVTVTQVRGNLTSFPTAVASGDVVINNTNGVLAVIITDEVVVGNATIRQAKDGEEVTYIPSGTTSSAFTLAGGEELMVLNTNGGVNTVDKIAATSAVLLRTSKKKD